MKRWVTGLIKRHTCCHHADIWKYTLFSFRETITLPHILFGTGVTFLNTDCKHKAHIQHFIKKKLIFSVIDWFLKNNLEIPTDRFYCLTLLRNTCLVRHVLMWKSVLKNKFVCSPVWFPLLTKQPPTVSSYLVHHGGEIKTTAPLREIHTFLFTHSQSFWIKASAKLRMYSSTQASAWPGGW